MTGNKCIDHLLKSMALEEKIGQKRVYGFSGTYPHPDILRVIEEYHVAGFRVTPGSRKFILELKPGSPVELRVQRAPEADERTYGIKLPAPAISPQAYARA